MGRGWGTGTIIPKRVVSERESPGVLIGQGALAGREKEERSFLCCPEWGWGSKGASSPGGQTDGPAGLTWWCNRPVESRNPLGQAEQR